MKMINNLHQNNELEQQKIILKEINRLLEKKISEVEIKTLDSEIQIKEPEQQKIMLKELSEIMSRDDTSVDEILEILSHEFRTFLVPIREYADMLSKGSFGELTERQKEKLRVIQENISHLYGVISEVMESKRLDLGKIVMYKTTNNITKLITKAIVKLDKKAREADTRIYFLDKPIFASFDSEKIFQVLIHLIENSIKSICNKEDSIFRTGKIVINTQEKDDMMIVQVKDNGGGIPKEKLSKLFLKYGKVDTSDTKQDHGIGLGLYLCKQIINAHGGKIWIESQDKIGTSVYFTLPKK